MARISIGNFDFIINSGGGGSADLTDLKNRVTSLESQLSNLPLQIVGESTQVGSSASDLNLNTRDDKVMINSTYEVAKLSPYPGEEGRKVLQLNNHDSLSGVSTTGEGANLIMMSKWDKVDIGSSKFPVNLNTNGTVTINDDKVVATTDQIEAWATVGNDEVIPSSKLPSFVDDVVEVAELPETGEAGKIYILTTDNTQYRWSGSEFVQITSGGVVIGSVTGTAYDGGKGTALEGRVTTVENNFANYPTKDELDIAINGATKDLVTQTDLEEATADLATKDEIKNYGDGTVGDGFQLGLADKRMNLNSNGTVMVNSVGEVVVATPYPGEGGRKVIQLANHDSLSGVGTDGVTGGNLAMLSKWDVADFGSKNFHTNFNVKTDNGHNGRVTVNDNNEVAYLTDIPEVIEFVGLTDLETGAASASIQEAIGLEFADLVETIGQNKAIFVDRNAAGDYKTCIHATGNISSGNGGANLMFMVGTVPTIYEVQYVNNEWALYVAEYEFAKKSDIPSVTDFATKEEVSAATANLVPNTRTIVGKALDSDITIDSSNLTDGDKLAFVYELNGLTDLQTGAGEDVIKAALGTEFEELLSIIRENKTVIVDRTTIGDYKTCIHATGNLSGGNGGINLMFFIGTKPTIFQIQYVSGTYALAVMTYEFAKKSDLEGYATTQDVSDSIAAEASARDKAIETATSDLVHNTLTVAGKSLTNNITLASADLTDGTELAKSSDVTELDAKVFGDLDVSKFEENPELTCQVTKLDASYTGDLGLPENINGQPYNAETNNANPSINYLVLGYFDEGFVFHYDAWDALHSSAIFSTIISTVGLTNSTLDNRVPKTTKVAGHALNADVELASTDLTDGDELARKDEILDTVVDESRNETLRQSLTARTYLPVSRQTDLTNQTEAQIFNNLFNAKVTDRASLRTYLQSNMAYISYNMTLSGMGEYQYYKIPITMASIPNTGDITIIAVGADINNGDVITKFTFTITLNGDASSVHMEKKALEV